MPALSTRRSVARISSIALALLLAVATVAAAHDMFVKPERFRVAPNTDVLVRLLNGTFSKSENAITRDRLLDVSLVTPTGRVALDTAAWMADGDTSTIRVRTGGAGTYVIGVSTRPRVLELRAKEFNEYLETDGIPDVLAERHRSGEFGKPARERYAKHVKALLQVGDAPDDGHATALGYPAEIVPLENPFRLGTGATLRVRTLVDGQPMANQYVLFGGRTTTGARIAPRNTRSDADGIARIPLGTRGTWYVKFINMRRLTDDPAADYESKWATVTFEVR